MKKETEKKGKKNEEYETSAVFQGNLQPVSKKKKENERPFQGDQQQGCACKIQKIKQKQ